MIWRSPYWVQDLQGRWHSGCGKGLDTACDIPITDRMMDTVRVGQPPDPSALMCQICLEKNTEEKSIGGDFDVPPAMPADGDWSKLPVLTRGDIDRIVEED